MENPWDVAFSFLWSRIVKKMITQILINTENTIKMTYFFLLCVSLACLTHREQLVQFLWRFFCFLTWSLSVLFMIWLTFWVWAGSVRWDFRFLLFLSDPPYLNVSRWKVITISYRIHPHTLTNILYDIRGSMVYFMLCHWTKDIKGKTSQKS